MSSETITEFLTKRFNTFPQDKVAVMEYPSGRCLNYNQLNTQTIAVASALSKRGFGRGQYLTHFGSNTIENVPIGYGVMATGGTIDLIQPNAAHEELVFHLRLVSPRFVVTTEDRVSFLLSALKDTRIKVDEIFVIGSAPANCRSAMDLLEDPGDANPMGKVDIKDDEDVAALLQTGGTTGMSKSVMIHHRGLKIMCTFELYCWNDNDIFMSYAPYGYMSSIISYIVNGYRGATVISIPRFDASEMLSAIEKHQVTSFFCGPAPAFEMIHSPKFKSCDMSSVKWAVWGGAPITKESEKVVIPKFKEKAPDFTIVQAKIGQTKSYTPFGYVSSVIAYIANGYRGGTVIHLPGFCADQMLRATEKYKATAFISGPIPTYDMIHSSIFNACDVSSFKWAIWGGAPICEEMVKECFREHAPDLIIYKLYGMTEATSNVTSFTEEDMKRKDKFGSCGRILSFITAKVVSLLDESIELKPGERGHIVIKAPTLMKGYFKNEEATAKVLKDGWYHTQDYGWIDEDGFMFVMDRIDELIVKQSGVIIPSELETVIKSHPKIQECVVLPKTIDGEKWPIAFAIRNEENVTSEEIQQFVANKVEPFSQLKGGVRFVNEIQKSLAGKLLRKKFLADIDEN